MIACARSGFENPDSGMGAYAVQPDDYDVLTPYLDACIRKYHKVDAGKKHVVGTDTQIPTITAAQR